MQAVLQPHLTPIYLALFCLLVVCNFERMITLQELHARYFAFYFKYRILVLFLHKSYGTPEFPDCGNLVGADGMENMRWANMEPFIHFRETNTDPSMHFRKANRIHPCILGRPIQMFCFQFYSQLNSQFYFRCYSQF